MQHYAAFHQNLRYMLITIKHSLEQEIGLHLHIHTCYPLIYTTYHSKFIVSNKKEQFISALTHQVGGNRKRHYYRRTYIKNR